jgi:hypothetical protein
MQVSDLKASDTQAALQASEAQASLRAVQDEMASLKQKVAQAEQGVRNKEREVERVTKMLQVGRKGQHTEWTTGWMSSCPACYAADTFDSPSRGNALRAELRTISLGCSLAPPVHVAMNVFTVDQGFRL